MKYDMIVEGMSCEHCEKAVSDAVKVLANVINVTVDIATKHVVVECDGVDAQVLKNTIEDQGYDVTKITNMDA